MGINSTDRHNQVMLVYGDDTDVAAVQAQLATLGFSVVIKVDSAAEALEIIHSENIDFMVTEKHIKGRLNGLQLAGITSKYSIPSVVLSNGNSELDVYEKPRSSSVLLLNKPFTRNSLQAALQEVESEVQAFNSKKEVAESHFFIRVNSRLQRIQLSAIEWIESEGNYCVIHYKNKRFALKISLRKVIDELECYPLAQIHKKYVVHLDKIEAIDISEGKVFLETKVLPIGRRYRQDFLERLHWIR